jgi:hypothetical protein
VHRCGSSLGIGIIAAVLFLSLFSHLHASEKLMPITLINNSSDFMLYDPFAFIYSQSFYLDDQETKKVGPLACNLRNYLKPVPEAWSTIQTYRTLRITALSSFLSGLAIMGTGFYLSFKDNAESRLHPLAVVGFGLSVSAAIPNAISKFLVSSAVEKYNKAIKKGKEQTSTYIPKTPAATLTIDLPTPGKYAVYLYSQNGQWVKSLHQDGPGMREVSLKDLSADAYLLECVGRSGKTARQIMVGAGGQAEQA